jgi:hypothetical protein
MNRGKECKCRVETRGRKRTSIYMHGETFRHVVYIQTTFSELSRELKISRQAINGWVARNLIRPKIMCKIIKILDLTPDIVKLLLTKPRCQK